MSFFKRGLEPHLKCLIIFLELTSCTFRNLALWWTVITVTEPYFSVCLSVWDALRSVQSWGKALKKEAVRSDDVTADVPDLHVTVVGKLFNQLCGAVILSWNWDPFCYSWVYLTDGEQHRKSKELKQKRGQNAISVDKIQVTDLLVHIIIFDLSQ